MSRGKPYMFLQAFKDDYGISITNSKFDEIISLEYRKTKRTRDLFNLLLKNKPTIKNGRNKSNNNESNARQKKPTDKKVKRKYKKKFVKSRRVKNRS